MAKLSLKTGTTSKLLKIFIQDSSVTTGAGLTGLTNASASLTAYYIREGDSSSTSMALQSATLGTWTTRGFIVVDGTNMKGLYEFGCPDAVLAAGAKSAVIVLQGATNMVPLILEIELTAVDNQSTGFGLVNASSNVAQWNSAAVATPNVSGVPLVDAKYILGTTISTPATAGILDVNIKNIANAAVSATTAQIGTNVVNWNNTVVATPVTAGIPDINIKNINNVVAATPGAAGGLFIAGTNAATTITTGLTTTFTGNLTGSVASVTGAVGSVTGAVGSVTGNVGGNVVGSTASVTARVTANTDQWNGTTVNGTVPPDTVFIRSAQAQSGGANTITLDASASATNNLYSGETIFIRSGAGAGQSAVITGYVGATKVATVSPAWATTPDSSSNFSILAMGPSATTVSGTVNANVIQWNSSNVVAPNVAGVPLVDLKYTLGTISPAAAGSVAIDWAQVSNKTSTVNLSGTTVGTVTSSTVTTNNDKTGYSLTQTFPSNFSSLAISAGGAAKVDGTSALTESYAAQGAALTLAQSLYGINQFLGQHSTSGTTWTVKKRDASTTAKTFTLDSATAPTSITEAT